MGFNVLDKVILRFKHRFWPKATDWMIAVADSIGETVWFLSVYKQTQEPILIAFVSPTQATRNESLPGGDEAITNLYLTKLEKLFGSSVRELFVESRCTHWKKDPLFYGSYSGYVVGSTGADWDILSEPIHDGHVGFAGEATRRVHPGTVDAAALSGKREAERIAANWIRTHSNL